MHEEDPILEALKERRWGAEHLSNRIVLVDDSTEVCETLAYLLRHAQFDVVTASNGMLALEVIRKHKPKVAIIDLFLPHVSGFELCDTIRKDPRLQEMFIIALTGMAEDTEELTEMKGSADVCLLKPVDDEQLVSLLRTVMSKMSTEPGLRRHLSH